MGKCVSKQTANSNWETGSADCVAVSERSFVLLIDDEVIIHMFYYNIYIFYQLLYNCYGFLVGPISICRYIFTCNIYIFVVFSM